MTESCKIIGSAETYSLLKQLSDVQILIHSSPDGDCIGGGYALYHILKQMGVRSRVLCADPIPPLYHDITDGVEFEDFTPKYRVSVDVGDRKLFGELPEEERAADIVLCIDHHVSNTKYAKHLHWDPEASAACEVLFQFIRAHHLELTREIAVCLYIGMATDTGCFRFSNAGAETFAAVSEIKRAFPDLPYARINRDMFVIKTRGRIALDSHLMQNIRFSSEGRVGLIYASAELLKSLAVTDEDTDGMPNLPMQVQGVEIGITVKQKEDGSYRVSFRAGEYADVSAIARKFGGGGHVKAAGCSFTEGDPEEIISRLTAAAAAALQEQV